MTLNKITFLNIFSIIYMISLIIIYLSKQRIKNRENKAYTWIIYDNIIGLFLQLCCDFVTQNSEQIPNFLTQAILKLYLVHFIIFLSVVTRYLYIITIGDKSKWIYKFNTILFVLLGSTILVLPIQWYFDKVSIVSYSYGPAVQFTFIVSFVQSIFLFLYLIFNRKNIVLKKSIPIYSFILFGLICGAIQNKIPEYTLMGCAESLICFLMYFTIENPDVKMLEQVELERDRADKANQAKSDFLSSMSHEIRTPLNAIVGFSECINQSTTLEEAKENAKDVMGASETLLEIVNGILDISKIESGKIELVESDYSPQKMIDEVVKLARGRLGEKPLDFQVNIAPDLPKALYGDKFNIKKIIINFLTNAIKYTDEGFVRFDVQCVKLNNSVRLIFIVSDSGRGIKKEDINKLFTKFQRLDEEKNQTIEGTGLGLAITKQLIEMMKGTVVVDSVYGEGSKFTFSVDQKLSDAVLDDTTTKLDVVVDLTGKKLLIVDDNKLNLKVADKLLKVYNPSVTLCNSGPDCIDLINDGNKYDLIFLDDMMPGMTGVETLHHLKENPAFNIPTIALTANAINGMKEKYLDAGFDGYLAKPIDKYELNSTLVKFLNNLASYDINDENENSSIKLEQNVIKPIQEQITESISDNSLNDDNNTTPDSTPNTGFKPYVPDNTPIVILPGNKEKEAINDIPTEESKESSDSSKILLIVDDNNLNIKVESKLMSSLGYTVESANSGIEAISKVKTNKYDLIFMDIMMPMMDGVQTLHELKKIEGFNTPVVALTADAVLGAKEKYLAEGFDLYVTKPADKDELQEVLNKFNV